MRIALTHNLRVGDSEDEAEFDSPSTISAIARALSRPGHRVEPFDVTGPASLLVLTHEMGLEKYTERHRIESQWRRRLGTLALLCPIPHSADLSVARQPPVTRL